jgi:uncharacterized membrane protein YedE/YeeE
MIIIWILVGLVMGIIFGTALEKGRVFEPGMIVGQFQLRNFIMLKMFMTAIITTWIVVGLMYAMGLVELHPKAAVFPANIVGGLIFGAGMALAGACPGTVLAQIGAGYKDAWVIIAGALCGALAYGYLEPILSIFSKGPGKITVMDMTGVPYTVLGFVMAVIVAGLLFGLEKWRPWRHELGRDYEGLLDEDRTIKENE